MASDMLGGDAASGQAGPAAEAGTIEALAGRLHSLLSARNDEDDAAQEDHPAAIAGEIVADQGDVKR
jgi:hypothetical protein